MKLNLPATLMIFVGMLLIYSAYKDSDPRDVVAESLGIKRRTGFDKAGKAAADALGKITQKGAVATPQSAGAQVVTV